MKHLNHVVKCGNKNFFKHNQHWIPVVWNWLPDKSEVSYKVFLYLIQEKLKELGIQFIVKEMISDFELSIHKSIVEMIQEVRSTGCQGLV